MWLRLHLMGGHIDLTKQEGLTMGEKCQNLISEYLKLLLRRVHLLCQKYAQEDVLWPVTAEYLTREYHISSVMF